MSELHTLCNPAFSVHMHSSTMAVHYGRSSSPVKCDRRSRWTGWMTSMKSVSSVTATWKYLRYWLIEKDAPIRLCVCLIYWLSETGYRPSAATGLYLDGSGWRCVSARQIWNKHSYLAIRCSQRLSTPNWTENPSDGNSAIRWFNSHLATFYCYLFIKMY